MGTRKVIFQIKIDVFFQPGFTEVYFVCPDCQYVLIIRATALSSYLQTTKKKPSKLVFTSLLCVISHLNTNGGKKVKM